MGDCLLSGHPDLSGWLSGFFGNQRQHPSRRHRVRSVMFRQPAPVSRVCYHFAPTREPSRHVRMKPPHLVSLKFCFMSDKSSTVALPPGFFLQFV